MRWVGVGRWYEAQWVKLRRCQSVGIEGWCREICSGIWSTMYNLFKFKQWRICVWQIRFSVLSTYWRGVCVYMLVVYTQSTHEKLRCLKCDVLSGNLRYFSIIVWMWGLGFYRRKYYMFHFTNANAGRRYYMNNVIVQLFWCSARLSAKFVISCNRTHKNETLPPFPPKLRKQRPRAD